MNTEISAQDPADGIVAIFSVTVQWPGPYHPSQVLREFSGDFYIGRHTTADEPSGALTGYVGWGIGGESIENSGELCWGDLAARLGQCADEIIDEHPEPPIDHVLMVENPADLPAGLERIAIDDICEILRLDPDTTLVVLNGAAPTKGFLQRGTGSAYRLPRVY